MMTCTDLEGSRRQLKPGPDWRGQRINTDDPWMLSKALAVPSRHADEMGVFE